MNSHEQDQPSSVLTAAQAGLRLGALLSLIYFARILGLAYSVFALLYFAGLILVPLYAYRLTKQWQQAVYRPALGFSWAMGLGYVLRLHAFAGILALVPQFFYFRYFVPQILTQMEQQLSTQPQLLAGAAGASLSDALVTVQSISLWQWLWADYCMTLLLGLLWGILVGLILRRRPMPQY